MIEPRNSFRSVSAGVISGPFATIMPENRGGRVYSLGVTRGGVGTTAGRSLLCDGPQFWIGCRVIRKNPVAGTQLAGLGESCRHSHGLPHHRGLVAATGLLRVALSSNNHSRVDQIRSLRTSFDVTHSVGPTLVAGNVRSDAASAGRPVKSVRESGCLRSRLTLPNVRRPAAKLAAAIYRRRLATVSNLISRRAAEPL